LLFTITTMGCVVGKTESGVLGKTESGVLGKTESLLQLREEEKDTVNSPSSPPVYQIQLGNSPPDEQTTKLIRKEEALRKLWLPGSIWAGTITINGTEAPWEVHVERDSTPKKISAKRVDDFDHFTFLTAERVEFFLSWEAMQDNKGNHDGWEEVITFEWIDADYRLFADTLNGIIDLRKRKIEGLVVDNRTKSIGHFEFCRVMANKKLGQEDTIRTPTFNIDNERADSFVGAVNRTTANNSENNVEQAEPNKEVMTATVKR